MAAFRHYEREDRFRPAWNDVLTLDNVYELHERIRQVFIQAHPPHGEWARVTHIDDVPVRHVCSDGVCPFMYNYREVYVCLYSGHIHHCMDNNICNLAVQNEECRVCPLTCKSYTLPFTYTWDDGERTAAYRSQRSMKVAGGTYKQRTKVHRELASATVASTKRYTAITDDQIHSVVSLVSSWLDHRCLRLVGMQPRPLTDRARQTALANEILSLYHRLCSLCTPPAGYTLPFHVYLMLKYMSRAGCVVRGATYEVRYVSSQPDVTFSFDPDEARALSHFKLTRKFVTSAQKLFQTVLETDIHAKQLRSPIEPARTGSL